jgi:chromosome segregation ATPase
MECEVVVYPEDKTNVLDEATAVTQACGKAIVNLEKKTVKLLLFKVTDINQLSILLEGGAEGVEQLKLRICLQDAEMAQLNEDLRKSKERGDYLEKALLENKELSQRMSRGFEQLSEKFSDLRNDINPAPNVTKALHFARERGDKLEKALFENNQMSERMSRGFEQISQQLSDLRSNVGQFSEELSELRNDVDPAPKLTEDLRVARERGDKLEKALVENNQMFSKRISEMSRGFKELSEKLSALRIDVDPALQHLQGLQNIISFPLDQPEGERVVAGKPGVGVDDEQPQGEGVEEGNFEADDNSSEEDQRTKNEENNNQGINVSNLLEIVTSYKR